MKGIKKTNYSEKNNLIESLLAPPIATLVKQREFDKYITLNPEESSKGNISHYMYKNEVIEPKSFYVLPWAYREPSIEEILTECIIQDTHKPDIRHLEIIPEELVEFKIISIIDNNEFTHSTYNTKDEAEEELSKMISRFGYNGSLQIKVSKKFTECK